MVVYEECPQSENKENKVFFLNRKFLAFSSLFATITSYGFADGITPIIIHQLEDSPSTIKIKIEEASWIASVYPLMMMIGCFLSAWISELWGRKPVILIFVVISTIGWFAIYTSKTLFWLILGRMINGLCNGASTTATTCYLSDVVKHENREFCLGFVIFCITLGTVIANVLGTFLYWRNTALICTLVPIIPGIALILIPESFIWYLNVKRFDDAKKSFTWFRGTSKDSLEEFEKLSDKLNCFETKRKNLTKLILKKEFLRPLIVVCLFFGTTQLSGYQAVVSYALTIFKKTVKGLNEYTTMVILDMFKLIMSGLAPFIIRKFKIRQVAIISASGVFISLFLFALLVHYSEMYPQNNIVQLAPLAALLFYVCFITGGILPLKFAVSGTMFSSATKAFGNGIGCTSNFLFYFIVIKTNLNMMNAFGHSITFCFYACMVMTGTMIMYFKLPETKGKTSSEIEDWFAK